MTEGWPLPASIGEPSPALSAYVSSLDGLDLGRGPIGPEWVDPAEGIA